MEHLLKDASNPLAWLEGSWETEGLGSGKYPTIKDFNYREEINVIQIDEFKFSYNAQSWHPELKRPMHWDKGNLEIDPKTQKASLYLIHNFGVETVEVGTITDHTISFESFHILRSPESKPPAVTKICRKFKLDGDYLEHVLLMSTSSNPELTEHLRARYKKKHRSEV